MGKIDRSNVGKVVTFGEVMMRLSPAVAASWLKHSVWGDSNLCSVAEVEETVRSLRKEGKE